MSPDEAALDKEATRWALIITMISLGIVALPAIAAIAFGVAFN